MANTDGSRGPICNTCGGYGLTNKLGGGSIGCVGCLQTGIQLPDIWDMQRRIEELEEYVQDLNEQLRKRGISAGQSA